MIYLFGQWTIWGCNIVKVWQTQLWRDQLHCPSPQLCSKKIIRYLETTQASEDSGKHHCKTEINITTGFSLWRNH